MAKRIIVLEKEGNRKWTAAFWLVVPPTRVSFYAQAGLVSQWKDASGPENSALAAGQVREVVRHLSFEQDQTAQQIRTAAEVVWQQLQDETDAYNPWANYGTFWDDTLTWTPGGVA